MKAFKNDIAVAMIFFNRPECFEQVFKAVAEQRPSRLYLIQDGPRANRPNDKEKIEKCRKIAQNIDWECKVTLDYSDDNLGCGKRIFTGLTKVFEKEEFAVIIEDDILVGESFFPFCIQMNERYKNDERIGQISGMNHLGVYKDCPYDYFFANSGGAIWGWATWRRVWKELDWNMEIMSEPYIQRCLDYALLPCGRGKDYKKRAMNVRQNILNGKAPSFWSLHFALYRALSNRLNIVPKYNLTANIGLTADTTHGTDSIKKVCKRMRVVFFGKIYNVATDDLKHPQYIMDDEYYMMLQDRIMKPSRLVRFFELFEKSYIKLFVR